MKLPIAHAVRRAPGPRRPAAQALAVLLAIASSLAASAHAAEHLDGLEDPNHFVQRDGESIYHAICQGCHMPDGKGAQGAGHYPALAENPRVGAAPYILHNVIHGRYGMPAFGSALDDEQVAAVVSYVRSHFGNHFDKVSAAEAKSERASTD
jgi:mono/diheme cytochrome c family protein